MGEIDEFCRVFPKNYLAVTIWLELGDELVDELETAGCQLIIQDDLMGYDFTDLTPQLRAKVDQKKHQEL